MKHLTDNISAAVHVLVALANHTTLYYHKIVAHWKQHEEPKIDPGSEYILLINISVAISDCIHMIGMDERYSLKTIKRRKDQVEFAEVYLLLFLDQDKLLYPALQNGDPLYLKSYKLYLTHLVYVLVHYINSENFDGKQIARITQNEQRFEELAAFALSDQVPVKVTAQLALYLLSLPDPVTVDNPSDAATAYLPRR